MDDLISRQAAIDALGDEPEVWSGKDEYEQGLNNQWRYDVNALKAVPSAQPEIIRCKDCKHRPSGTGTNHDLEFPDYVCPCQNTEDGWYSWKPKDDWFCADGERKEE